MTANKEVSVAEVWEPSYEGGVWTPCFIRSFNDCFSPLAYLE